MEELTEVKRELRVLPMDDGLFDLKDGQFWPPVPYRLGERMSCIEVMEGLLQRFVDIGHVNVKVTTGKKVLVIQHHGFNIVTDIMYRLGLSSRWTIEAAEGKKRMEAANSHRNS